MECLICGDTGLFKQYVTRWIMVCLHCAAGKRYGELMQRLQPGFRPDVLPIHKV